MYFFRFTTDVHNRWFWMSKREKEIHKVSTSEQKVKAKCAVRSE